MQGPKLRVGPFAAGKAMLAEGAEFSLDKNPEPGDVDRVYLPHPELFEVVAAGQSLLLDDGKLRLEVVENSGEGIRTRVMHGGVLSDSKRGNVSRPNLRIPLVSGMGTIRAEVD